MAWWTILIEAGAAYAGSGALSDKDKAIGQYDWDPTFTTQSLEVFNG